MNTILNHALFCSIFLAIGCTSLAKPSKGQASSEVPQVKIGPSNHTPTQIFIVRHGEKPVEGPELTERGQQRAHALPGWFTEHAAILEVGVPTAVFASGPDHVGGSVRSIQTCQPFADKFNVHLDSEFSKEQFQEVAARVRSDDSLQGKSLLFCWEHKKIPFLARAFGATQAPASWPDDVFDRVWVLTFKDGVLSSFQNLPQHLLPGDSEK